MKKGRKWDERIKARIVLDGLKGLPVAEICNEHQIAQSQAMEKAARQFKAPWVLLNLKHHETVMEALILRLLRNAKPF